MLNTDPTHIDGQRVVIVRSNAEYAKVAGTQLVIAQGFWMLIGHILLPFWMGLTFGLMVVLPAFLFASVSTGLMILVGLALVPVWVYFGLWRWFYRPLFRHIPKIVHADGYHGIFGTDKTVWINLPDPETVEPTPDVIYVPNVA